VQVPPLSDTALVTITILIDVRPATPRPASASRGRPAHEFITTEGTGKIMGELGTVRRYSYWSSRRVSSIANDNGINLDGRWRIELASPQARWLPQLKLTRDPGAVQRHNVAAKVERAVGQLAVEDFVTPPKAAFAKGSGDVTFAAYTLWRGGRKKAHRKGVIIHTKVESSSGCRVEICLFGSIDNCAGPLSASAAKAPTWESSSTWCIEEFIANRGVEPAPVYDDSESIAVEVLRVFNNEGMTGRHVFQTVTSAEWFAEVYHDVDLDKSRWDLSPREDLPDPVDRIVIGAPLWVRSNSS
jgi:hypothetical protein